MEAFRESTDSKQFIGKFESLKIEHASKLVITPRPKILNNELANILLNSDLDTNLLIKNYWKYINTRIELMRFSKESKVAFEMFKRVYKYQIRRKEGEIINSINKEGQIITPLTKFFMKNYLKYRSQKESSSLQLNSQSWTLLNQEK